MMILPIVILAGLIYGIYYIFSNKGNSNNRFPFNKNPEEILKERYVNGEIDEETYLRMKKTLNN